MKVWSVSMGENHRGVFRSKLFFNFEDAKKLADEWITHSNFKTWRWEPDGTSAFGGCDYIEIELVEIH